MVSKVAHPFPSLSLGEVVAVTKWMPSGHHSKAVESLACTCDVRYTVKWDLFALNRFHVKLLHAEVLHKSKYSCVLLSAHPYHYSADKTLACIYVANLRLLNSLRKFGVWKPVLSSISVITMSLNNYIGYFPPPPPVTVSPSSWYHVWHQNGGREDESKFYPRIHWYKLATIH